MLDVFKFDIFNFDIFNFDIFNQTCLIMTFFVSMFLMLTFLISTFLISTFINSTFYSSPILFEREHRTSITSFHFVVIFRGDQSHQSIFTIKPFFSLIVADKNKLERFFPDEPSKAAAYLNESPSCGYTSKVSLLNNSFFQLVLSRSFRCDLIYQYMNSVTLCARHDRVT